MTPTVMVGPKRHSGQAGQTPSPRDPRANTPVNDQKPILASRANQATQPVMKRIESYRNRGRLVNENWANAWARGFINDTTATEATCRTVCFTCWITQHRDWTIQSKLKRSTTLILVIRIARTIRPIHLAGTRGHRHRPIYPVCHHSKLQVISQIDPITILIKMAFQSRQVRFTTKNYFETIHSNTGSLQATIGHHLTQELLSGLQALQWSRQPPDGSNLPYVNYFPSV